MCYPRLLTLLVICVMVSLADSAGAQTGFYSPRGYRSSGAGYSYAAPSYVFGGTARGYLGGGYRTLSWSPGYLSTIRIPRLSYIQPQYQSAYRYDRGGPAFVYAPVGSSRYLPTLTRTYALGNYAYLPAMYQPAVYRPYVTVSHYLYTPTYYGATYFPAVPYGAVYGAYGYSAIYGY